MAFLRFNRDTKGYEHFYLVQPTTNRRGKVRHKLLYWFRTPPNVKVGREPFDETVRRALEAQNPDVQFDWKSIVDTPIPPPVEAERWRERRRFERAARQAAAEESGEVTSGPIGASEPPDMELEVDSPVGSLQALETTTLNGEPVEPLSPPSGLGEPGKPDAIEARGESRPDAAQGGPIDTARRKRRRRRGRRGRPIAAGASDQSAAPEPRDEPSIEHPEPSDPEEE